MGAQAGSALGSWVRRREHVSARVPSVSVQHPLARARSLPVGKDPSSPSPAPFPAACSGSRNRTSPPIHQGTSASRNGLEHKSKYEERFKKKKEVGGRKNQGRGWGERAKEAEWWGREIKGKNSSEITELFIFPALILWAFEASTLMYLDILGPSVTGGHPSPSAWAQPPKGTSVPSTAAAPSAAAHGAF